jgi:cephalosporin hydroxylase
MQEIIWRVEPDLIIETGIAHGGSLVLYASILELQGGNSYVVVFDKVVEDIPAGYFADRPWDKGNNSKTAVWKFLRSNERFVIDEDFDNKLLLTLAPDGRLMCVKD